MAYQQDLQFGDNVAPSPALAYAMELNRAQQQDSIKLDMEMLAKESDLLSGGSLSDVKHPFAVGHLDEFTILYSATVRGTLDEFAADPSKLKWKAFVDKYPEDARAFLVATDIHLVQNTGPVPFGVKIKGLESRSLAATNKIGELDYVIPSYTTQSILPNLNTFSRDPSQIAMANFNNWDQLTEEKLRGEVIEKIPSKNVARVKNSGVLVSIIRQNLGSRLRPDTIIELTDPVTGELSDSAIVELRLVEQALTVGIRLIDNLPLCHPGNVEVVFSRADGEAVNAVESLVDKAPVMGAYQRETLASQVIQLTFAVKAKFIKWHVASMADFALEPI